MLFCFAWLVVLWFLSHQRQNSAQPGHSNLVSQSNAPRTTQHRERQTKQHIFPMNASSLDRRSLTCFACLNMLLRRLFLRLWWEKWIKQSSQDKLTHQNSSITKLVSINWVAKVLNSNVSSENCAKRNNFPATLQKTAFKHLLSSNRSLSQGRLCFMLFSNTATKAETVLFFHRNPCQEKNRKKICSLFVSPHDQCYCVYDNTNINTSFEQDKRNAKTKQHRERKTNQSSFIKTNINDHFHNIPPHTWRILLIFTMIYE